jgi:hypothetical protein
LWLLLGLGFALNLGLLYLYYTPAPKRLQGDEHYYTGVATAIASGQPVDWSPLWPPFYGQLMGHLFALVGVHPIAMQAVQIVAWLAAGIMIHRTALALASDRLAANVTAGLFLLSPELMAFSHFFWSEMMHLVFMVAAFWLMACHPRNLVAVVASGVLVGLALLTKLLLFPIACLVPVAFALCTTIPWRMKLGRALLIGVAIAVTIAPTMIENHARYGKLMIADSSALGLWLGLNPSSDHPREVEQFMASGPDMATRNAIYHDKVLQQIRRQGVLATLRAQLSRQYFLLFQYETWFTLSLPGSVGTMRGHYELDSPRLVLFLHVYAHLAHALLLAGMAIGLAALHPRRARWWNVLLAFLFFNLALYLFVNTNARYFVQMMPAAMLFAGVGVRALVDLARGRLATGDSPFALTRGRLVLATGLVVLVEFLAFRNLPTFGI